VDRTDTIKRDLQTIVERGGESARIGEGMLDEVPQMFTWWHRVRDGTLARSTFRTYMRAVKRRFEALLAEGEVAPHPKTSRTCALLLRRRDALWTFVNIGQHRKGSNQRTMAPNRSFATASSCGSQAT
jgi:transposase